MNYITADIHGCYQEFLELLEVIDFSDEDTLYVLGDSVDRGPQPIPLVQDLMGRPNVRYVLGNHDYYMYGVFTEFLNKYGDITSDDDIELADLDVFVRWGRDGGTETINQFLDLDYEDQLEILAFFEEASLYEELEVGEDLYVMVHAGIAGYHRLITLDQYLPENFLYKRTNYMDPLFYDEKAYLVTGHTPTMLIRKDGKPLIYKKNGHIAVDCGCVFGGNLAAYCVETGKEYYVKSKNAK